MTEIALKNGVKSQMFKLSELRAEHIDVVRERVLTLIKGKKLIGYHLPQKIADLGLLGELDEKPETQVKQAETDPSVPNALQDSEKATFGMPVEKPDKKKTVLQITEAYDMAKVFNAQLSAQQQPITLLCEKYLNLNFKKRPSPCFAVSVLFPLLTFC